MLQVESIGVPGVAEGAPARAAVLYRGAATPRLAGHTRIRHHLQQL